MKSKQIEELYLINDFLYNSDIREHAEQEFILIKDSINKIVSRELPDSEDILHLSQLCAKAGDEKVKETVAGKIIELLREEEDFGYLSTLLDNPKFEYYYSSHNFLIEKIKGKLTQVDLRRLAEHIKEAKREYGKVLTGYLVKKLSDCQDKDILLDVYQKTRLLQIKEEYLPKAISDEIMNLVVNCSSEDTTIIGWLRQNRIDIEVTITGPTDDQQLKIN